MRTNREPRTTRLTILTIAMGILLAPAHVLATPPSSSVAPLVVDRPRVQPERERVEAPRSLTSWTTGYREQRRLHSATPQARVGAAEQLGWFGDPARARESLIEALPAEANPLVKQAIVEALTRRAHPDSADVIIDALRSGIATEAVAIALAEVGTADCVRALIESLGNATLGEHSENALVRIGAPAVPSLIASLREGITIRAIRALGRIGRRDATLPLLPLVAHESPPIQQEVVRALGAIGDSRAAPALRERLESSAGDSAADLLSAIAKVGSREDGDAISGFLGEGEMPLREAALRAMLSVDPSRGARAIEDAVTSDNEIRVGIAADVAIDWPIPEVVPVLYGLLTEGTRIEDAASSLTAVADGAGVPVLLQEARKDNPPEVVVSELAASLRRHTRTLTRRTRRSALAVLREVPGHRGVLLRALAQASDHQEVRRLLASDDAMDRAIGAHAMLLHGDARDAEALTRLGAREGDPEAFRRIAQAAIAFHVDAPFPAIFQKLADPETRGDALVWAAASLDEQSRRTRHRILETTRRDLRVGGRSAVMAAWAIAEARDRAGYRALLAAVQRGGRDVRFAAARALTVLRVPAADLPLRAEARVESDLALRRVLLDAADAPERRPQRFSATGRFTLRVAVSAHGDANRVPLDVLLPDGRWLRILTAAGGELILTDLPDGTADVRVRL